MANSSNGRPPSAGVEPLPPAVREALAVLREAHDGAQRLQVPDWQCAVELARLYGRGVSESTLRLVLGMQWAENRLETTELDSTSRTFRSIGNLALPEGTCFILTAAGLEVLRNGELGPSAESATTGIGGPRGEEPAERLHAPFWDGDGSLWWGSQLIKCLNPQAHTQRLLLAAFQEERWPHRLDDPLPGSGGSHRRERLRQAVKHLNEGHQCQVIRFRVDRSGQAILWDWV